jgi:hypothetical protein
MKSTLASRLVLALKIGADKRTLRALIAEAWTKADRRRSCAREPGVEVAGDALGEVSDGELVAAVAIDKAGHSRRAVAGAEPDNERAAVVLEMRLAVAVPNDDDPRALARSSRVREIPAHAGDDRLRPLRERQGLSGQRNLGSHPGEGSSKRARALREAAFGDSAIHPGIRAA